MRSCGISAIRRWKRGLWRRGEEGKMRKKEKRRSVFIVDGKYIDKEKGIQLKHVSSKKNFHQSPQPPNFSSEILSKI